MCGTHTMETIARHATGAKSGGASHPAPSETERMTIGEIRALIPAPVASGFSEVGYIGNFAVFEDGLDNVTASYSLRNDGDIRVINRGFDTENQEWSDAEGRAWVPEPSASSVLKVSFFWPFSASYKVIVLAEDYTYAMVTSSSKDYLWILARQPALDDSLYSSLVEQAKAWGFDIKKLIKVGHDKSSSGS